MIRRLLTFRAASVAPLVSLALAAACAAGADTGAGGGEATSGDSVETRRSEAPLPAADTALVVKKDTTTRTAPVALSPVADTIAQRLVFAPVMQRWFVAAARGKRLLVDLGRVDIEIKKGSARESAFEQAVAARSPIPKGARLRLHGGWGNEDATVTGFTSWNGRIAATLDVSPLVDSLAKVRDPLIASAERVAQESPAVASPCDRSNDSTVVAALLKSANALLDSLKASPDQPLYARLKGSLKSRTSAVAGCFGEARGIAVASLYAGDYEWVRERFLLVSGDSLAPTKVKKLGVRDLRFRAHETLEALDADGDGIDDLAARAWTPRGGGTVLLTLRDGKLERLAQGFSWER